MEIKRKLPKYFVIFMLTGLVAGFVLVKAALAYLQYYRANHSSNIVVDAVDALRYSVTNYSPVLDYFVPNNSVGEWLAFKQAANTYLSSDLDVTLITDGFYSSAIATGGLNNTCSISFDNNRVYCWGNNASGHLGLGYIGGPHINRPTTTIDTLLYNSVSSGGQHSCGILNSNRRVKCWGQNYYGQLGNGVPQNPEPAPVPTPTLTVDSNPYIVISTGNYHSCGVMVDGEIPGRVKCWGRNTEGALGIGTTDNGVHSTPVLTTDTNNYRLVSAGNDFTCGIRSQETARAYCWGSNSNGQLGDGTTIDRLTPTMIQYNNPMTAISTGLINTCGIRSSDLRVMCWGANNYGQLGNNTTNSSLIPVLTSDTSAYFAVSVGELDHACGIRNSDRRVLCWGRNNLGQLGNGTTNNSLVPVETADNSRYIAVEAGASHTCGITESGATKCWGNNAVGLLGDGTFINRLVPTLVASP